MSMPEPQRWTKTLGPTEAEIIPFPSRYRDPLTVSSPEVAKFWFAHMRDQLDDMKAKKAKPGARIRGGNRMSDQSLALLPTPDALAVEPDPSSRLLALVEPATNMLVRATRVDEVNEIRGQADALERYARVVQLSTEAVGAAQVIARRAEVRIGELDRAAGQGRPGPTVDRFRVLRSAAPRLPPDGRQRRHR